MKDLKDVRNKIDEIDDKIVELFKERMAVVKDVAEYKKQNNVATNDKEREDEIIFRLTSKLDEEYKIYLKEIYSTIFCTSKAYQSQIIGGTSPTAEKIRDLLNNGLSEMPVSATVACQGVKGANSANACKKLFPISDITYCKNFEGVFSAVEQGLCEYGVLPIENSTAGSVLEVYDLMKKHDFHIVRSIRVKIEHSLASISTASLKDIKTVISHPQALSQCKEYLDKLGVKTVECENTAVAAKKVLESNDKTVAALCSYECAQIYGLKILDKDVQDSKNNYTRFICISKDLQIKKGADRISVMTSLPHTPGSLGKLINRFSALGLNLNKIESRPIVNSDFEFMFYFDFEGDVADKKVIDLLSELENGSDKFVFLGSYKELL